MKSYYYLLNKIKQLLATTSENRRINLKINQGKPIPFEWGNITYYLNPDKSAFYHIKNSTNKIHKMVQLIEPNPNIVFDVGGNCGLFSAFAKKCFPSSKIYCFEPSLELQKIITHNCPQGIESHQIALSSNDEERRFYINPSSQQTNSLSKGAVELFCSSPSEKIVRCRSIDSFCIEKGISRIDVLKLDVQGFESEVLKGAKEQLPTVQQLFIESTWMEVDSIINIVPFAIEKGFKYLSVVNDVFLGADILLSKELSQPDLNASIITFSIEDALHKSWF